jgi:hypothetical protein
MPPRRPGDFALRNSEQTNLHAMEERACLPAGGWGRYEKAPAASCVMLTGMDTLRTMVCPIFQKVVMFSTVKKILLAYPVKNERELRKRTLTILGFLVGLPILMTQAAIFFDGALKFPFVAYSETFDLTEKVSYFRKVIYTIEGESASVAFSLNSNNYIIICFLLTLLMSLRVAFGALELESREVYSEYISSSMNKKRIKKLLIMCVLLFAFLCLAYFPLHGDPVTTYEIRQYLNSVTIEVRATTLILSIFTTLFIFFCREVLRFRS